MRPLPDPAGGEIVKVSALALYALLVLLILSLLARFLPVPFGLFTVVSGSMEPSIRPLDIAVVAGRSYSVGDVVVWCTSPFFCVLHRVVEAGEGWVVTKGDANPVPDPKVPDVLVKGKVALVVPREAWLAPAGLYLAYLLVKKRREVARALSGAAALYGPLVAYMLLLMLTSLALAPGSSFSTTLKKPGVYLSRVEAVKAGERCAILIVYYLENVNLFRVLEVRVQGVEARVLEAGSKNLLAEIPEEVEDVALQKGRLNVTVAAQLTRMGRLSGSYTVFVPLWEPLVRLENGSLILENPSCFPLKVNVTWEWAERAGEMWRYEPRTYRLEREGRLRLEPPDKPYVYVTVTYRVWGVEKLVRVRVRG